mmetsp:Transcript_31518/g.77667  ORF Transcript_31518/g.77667 Transcript_31518/m.77667 type:complete len:206 (-) Transcript_31518:65-682(-)
MLRPMQIGLQLCELHFTTSHRELTRCHDRRRLLLLQAYHTLQLQVVSRRQSYFHRRLYRLINCGCIDGNTCLPRCLPRPLTRHLLRSLLFLVCFCDAVEDTLAYSVGAAGVRTRRQWRKERVAQRVVGQITANLHLREQRWLAAASRLLLVCHPERSCGLFHRNQQPQIGVVRHRLHLGSSRSARTFEEYRPQPLLQVFSQLRLR